MYVGLHIEVLISLLSRSKYISLSEIWEDTSAVTFASLVVVIATPTRNVSSGLMLSILAILNADTDMACKHKIPEHYNVCSTILSCDAYIGKDC